MSYEDDLRIDHDALDIESAEAAVKAQRYTKLAADANLKAKRASERMKTIRSEIILKVNQEPEKYLGIGIKATDAKVEAYYRTDPDYMKAKEELHEAEHEAEILDGAAWNMKMRNEDIGYLLRLLDRSYFMGPVEPRNLSEETKKRITLRRKESEQAGEEDTRRRLRRRNA